MVFKNLSLKNRFFLSFLILIVIPIFLIMGLTLRSYYETLYNAKLSESENITKRYADSIEEEMKRVALKTSALAFNSEFLDLVRQYSTSPSGESVFSLTREIDSILDIYFDYGDDIISLFLFLKQGELYIYKSPPLESREEMMGDPWYREMENNTGKITLLDSFIYQRVAGTPYYRFSAAIQPYHIAANSIDAVLVLYRSGVLNNLRRQGDRSNKFVIADRKGKLLFSSGFTGNQFPPEEEGTFLAHKVPVGNEGWNLINYMNINDVRRPVLDSFLIFLVLLIVITALFIIFVTAELKQIIVPINDSIIRMARVEKGDFSVRLDRSPIPELDKMALSFNNMVKEVEILTREIRRKEREKKSLEIRSLQYQINPHFLSNTLNSIKIMARMINAEIIRETTTSLMRIVSDSFRAPGELNPLGQEIKNLNDYINIMKVRFGDSFTVRVKLEKELSDYRIMKLLIQPLVENAVIHGLRDRERGGCLYIDVRKREGNLEIIVIDNGMGIEGIPPVIIDEDPHKGMYNIGLKNVIERIELNYGSRYGLKLTGKNGLYTKVTLCLPLIGGQR